VRYFHLIKRQGSRTEAMRFSCAFVVMQANGHVIDYDDWHAFVHGTLPYEQYLKPDPKLRALLESIPLPKYIFTNADSIHTERCLSLLGLQGCFAGIICFETVMKAAAGRGATHNNRPVVCKPNRMAMEIALQLAGEADAKSTAFFDDSTRNITMATRMGVYAALVGRTGVDCHADVQLRRIHDVPNLLPWLFAVGDGIPTDHGIVLEPEAEGAEELREEAGNGKSEIMVPA
jgi:pyrimidine and pyridine-specific 5'-nucleotidase